MNKFRIARAGIDVNSGLARMCGDVEMYEQLLIEFLEDKHYVQLKNAIDDNDVKAAFLAAHALKGVAGTMSMTKLYNAICPMVEVLRKDDLNISEFLPDVEDAYNKVIDAIKDMQNSKNS